ncbi:MAG: hypothetical protein WD512_01910 [Candidatus Paceibacterota bacterium]
MSVKLPPFPKNMMIILSNIFIDQAEDRETLSNRYISTNWDLLRRYIWNDIRENAYCVFFDLNSVKTNKTFFELKDYNNNRIEWLHAIMTYIAESIVRDIICFRTLSGHKFTSSLRILHQYDNTYPAHLIKVKVSKHDLGVYFPSDNNILSDDSELGEALSQYSPEEWNEKETIRIEKMYDDDDDDHDY